MGQQKTAAPVFSKVFRNLSQPDSTPDRYRLSVICQSVFSSSIRCATFWFIRMGSQTTDKRLTNHTCDILVGLSVLPCGEFENSRDVLGFQVGIVGKDLVARRACRQQFQDILHANTKTANGRTTATNVRADRDSLDRAHLLTQVISLAVEECLKIATASHHTLNHHVIAVDSIQQDVVADGKGMNAGPKVVSLPANVRMP